MAGYTPPIPCRLKHGFLSQGFTPFPNEKSEFNFLALVSFLRTLGGGKQVSGNSLPFLCPLCSIVTLAVKVQGAGM